MVGSKVVVALVVVLLGAPAGASSQEMVTSRYGTEIVEWAVHPSLWVETGDRPAAEAALAAHGLTEFTFREWGGGCATPSTLLFVRQNASAPPTLVVEALARLTGPAGGTPWFWSIVVESDEVGMGFVQGWTFARFVSGITAERAEEIVSSLGVGTLAFPDSAPPPTFTVLSHRRSGLDVLLDTEILFQHPEVEQVHPAIVAGGCPSGGAGGGGSSPVQIPALAPPGLLIMAFALALAFLRALWNRIPSDRD